MPRLRPQLRLWMLLALVAIAGLGLGGYRWWRGRQEMLRMAAWHEWRAGELVEVMEFLRTADVLPHELLELNRELKELGLPRDEVVRACASLGLPVPTNLERPFSARDEEIRTQLELWKTWREPFALACLNASRWHAERAKQLRRQRVFVVAREHELDRRQFAAVRQLAGRFGDAYTAGSNAARRRRKDAESASLKQLEPLTAALQGPLDAKQAEVEVRDLLITLLKCFNILDELSRQQDLHSSVQSQLQAALSSAPPDYQLPTPTPAATPASPPVQQVSARP